MVIIFLRECVPGKLYDFQTPSVINGLASGLFYFKAMCTIFPKDIKSFDQSK